MEVEIGTEIRDEYLSWEVAAGARKLIEDIMLTQPGENVVITADTSSDMRVVQATAKAAYAAGAVPSTVMHPTQLEGYQEPGQEKSSSNWMRAQAWTRETKNNLHA